MFDNFKFVWCLGMFVNVFVELGCVQVFVVVCVDVVQIVDDKLLVFVFVLIGFEVCFVKIGCIDGNWMEIFEGFFVGMCYVVVNSYVLKVEVGKFVDYGY